MFKRIVKLSKTHSFFLFGARGTGKSTLIRHSFPGADVLWIDLLNPRVLDEVSISPDSLMTMINAQPNAKTVVIDEIQRAPELLNVVHQLSSNKKLQFILTGSSARKLKRNAANLLAGRAFNYVCHPLLQEELESSFQLDEVLQFGTLPEIFSLSKEDKVDFLRAYVETYFKEEIVAEQIVRSLKPFKNFLHVAAQMNGQVLNISKIAKDVGVDHTTVQNYFEILEETLVGFLLEPFHESVRKRQRQASKFYYFDLGVQRALRRQLEASIVPQTSDYGDAFEHFCILEIKRTSSYRKPDWTFSYLRTKDDAEIDLIIERPNQKRALVEFKSTDQVRKLNAAKLNAFSNLSASIKRSETFLFSKDPIEQKIDHIWCLPWWRAIEVLGLK